MLKIISNLLTAALMLSFSIICPAQDEWEQQLEGWVDGVYYPYMFLGGTYVTRISLADIDNDGDMDIFYGGGNSGSLVYFENIGNANYPVFELRYEEFPGLTNWEYGGYGGTVDVDFADLDADGDLDAAYSGYLDSGGIIRWNDGTIDEPNFSDRRYPLGPMSGQSNVTLVDIDNDGDYDYFSGYGYYPHQLIFARNYGTPDSAFFLHQGDTHNYQDLNFGAGFNFDMGDLDNDADYDLIVCKRFGPVSYYENTGTPDSAYFTLITDDFLPGRDSVDWLESPELADIDADGDLDLFLASAFAHLSFFENRGTAEFPEFIQKYDTTFFYVHPIMGNAWLGNSVDIDDDGDDDIAPGKMLLVNESTGGEIRFTRYDWLIPFWVGTFVDMDGDDDYDYIAPAGMETVIYYENSGDSSWPEWDDGYSLFVDDRLDEPFTVAAGDIDNDGDNDVLIGHWGSQSIDYYRNDGTPQVWAFSYIGALDLPEWEFRWRYDILLDDIDDDDDLDLLIGDRSHNYDPIRLMFYRNDGTPEQPIWSFITADFQNAVSKHRNSSIAPCLADIDKDGDKDLVVTNNSIGMQLFLNPRIHTDVEEVILEESDVSSILQIYPNPSNSIVSFSLNLEDSVDLRVEIFNILGQSIKTLYSGPTSSGPHYFIWDFCKVYDS